MEMAPFVFSLGVFYSIVFISFAKSFFELERHWHRHEAAAGSSLCLVCRFSAVNPIKRWIAGKARRKEAPDEDADCPALNIAFY